MAFTSGIRDSERRPLRVFAFDPMVDRYGPPIVLRVPFEHLQPGPIGRLIAVTDVDLEKDRVLPPLDLDSPEVLIGSGLAPSEIDYRSHQQVVYAISMAVLEAFERGLGRPILWHAGRPLCLVPHGGEMANAFFEPGEFRVRFGTFKATDADQGMNVPGQTIYSCLAWDVVAHEVSHPVLVDVRSFEMGPRAPAPTSPETPAIHEGLCDLMALLVRMTDPSAVRPIVERNGVALEGTPLLQLASQFGSAAGLGTALRAFPRPGSAGTEEPHDLGVSLTSAVIEALLRTLEHQTRDLFGLHGPPRSDGWMHPDLVGRLAGTTTALAREVLDTCTGALDLLPPFDVRFLDVLRAAVTVSTERYGPRGELFRGRLIEAFFNHKLIPAGVDSLAVEALQLEPATDAIKAPLPHVGDALTLTQHAIELRRAYMTDPARIPGAAEAIREDLQQLKKWHRDVASFAKDHARRLGLDASRATNVANLTGGFANDPTQTIRARVTVQLEQPGSNGSERRGVTLVANSTGELQFVIRPHSSQRRSSPRWPYKKLTSPARRADET